MDQKAMIDDLVKKARKASEEYMKLDQETINNIVTNKSIFFIQILLLNRSVYINYSSSFSCDLAFSALRSSNSFNNIKFIFFKFICFNRNNH